MVGSGEWPTAACSPAAPTLLTSKSPRGALDNTGAGLQPRPPREAEGQCPQPVSGVCAADFCRTARSGGQGRCPDLGWRRSPRGQAPGHPEAQPVRAGTAGGERVWHFRPLLVPLVLAAVTAVPRPPFADEESGRHDAGALGSDLKQETVWLHLAPSSSPHRWRALLGSRVGCAGQGRHCARGPRF